MRRAVVSALVALSVFGMSMTAEAFPTASGPVVNLVVSSTAGGGAPEVISFQVSPMPNTGCPTGTSINVVYSNTICDAASGYAIPIAIIVP